MWWQICAFEGRIEPVAEEKHGNGFSLDPVWLVFLWLNWSCLILQR